MRQLGRQLLHQTTQQAEEAFPFEDAAKPNINQVQALSVFGICYFPIKYFIWKFRVTLVFLRQKVWMERNLVRDQGTL